MHSLVIVLLFVLFWGLPRSTQALVTRLTRTQRREDTAVNSALQLGHVTGRAVLLI
jgi:hypothetical protein